MYFLVLLKVAPYFFVPTLVILSIFTKNVLGKYFQSFAIVNHRILIIQQAYVDTNLVGTGKLTKAALFGHDGSLWATSAGFNVHFHMIQVSATEAQILSAAFRDASGIRANGLMIGGVKYIALRADDRSIYGKKA